MLGNKEWLIDNIFNDENILNEDIDEYERYKLNKYYDDYEIERYYETDIDDWFNKEDEV
jgi:hypothetical protein